MIIVVVLHMTQVFLWGAYKKPREATWMVGCVLLLVTLAFGLTGYLLPWDNRAYWGTVVTTQIASQAPGAGPYILRLLGSEGGAIGVVTFARFYAVHVLLLPPLTMLLIVIHVILVRRHGVAPAAGRCQAEEEVLSRAGVQGYRGDVPVVRGADGHGDLRARSAGARGRSHRHQLHSASGMVFSVSVPDAEAV